MTEPFHPYDAYCREQARVTNFEKLLENYEDANRYRDDENRSHVLELICAVSIARNRLLERELARADIELDQRDVRTAAHQERLARAQVRPHGGVDNVIPLRPRGAA